MIGSMPECSRTRCEPTGGVSPTQRRAWLAVRMRQASRMEDELKEDYRRSANRLRAVLHDYHVELLALLPSADEPWFWDLVALAPTPELGARLSPKRVEKLLREHRIRRITAQEVVDRLHRPPVPAAPGVVEASVSHVLMLVPRLHLLYQQLSQCQAQIETMLGELAAEDPAGKRASIVTSSSSDPCPGPGDTGSPRCSRRPKEDSAQETTPSCVPMCGSAPITKQSGRSRVVQMRYACIPDCETRCTTGRGTPR